MPELIASKPTVADAAPAAGAQACRACGAPVEAGDRFCAFCGATQPQQGIGGQEGKTPAGPVQSYFRCQSCGAEVAVDQEHRSYTCAFCDSNYVVEFTPEQTGRLPPEFIIGFAIPPDEAQRRFREWLGRGTWFRPGDLGMAQIEGKLRGAYIPFWSFSMLAESRWSASIGEHWYETQTYTVMENGKPVTKTRRVQHTEWWDLSGGHHQYYSGFLISGSRGLSQDNARDIQPFHLPALKRYEPYFLAGWLSEEYSVGRDEALKVSQQEFAAWENDNVAAFLPGDTYSKLNVQTQFSQVNSDLILLPIYVLSYRYQDRLYRFLINGQTGKTIGEKPISWPKVALTGGLTLLLVFIIMLLLFLLNH
jgi:DNA-directed RNA polymerase subunit RPC12/RpoP